MKPWQQFLDDLSDYLYEHGWYTQSEYVRKNKSLNDIITYLTNHCYDRGKAERVVKLLR